MLLLVAQAGNIEYLMPGMCATHSCRFRKPGSTATIHCNRIRSFRNNAFRVDFAFWTGEKFYAVEIDGNEPDGYAADVRRDRLLRRAGIDVIHVLNNEIMQHGVNLIKALAGWHYSRPQWRFRRSPVLDSVLGYCHLRTLAEVVCHVHRHSWQLSRSRHAG